ncbi:MAG: hypothetical protein WKG52_18050 [Variovorax sp.]
MQPFTSSARKIALAAAMSVCVAAHAQSEASAALSLSLLPIASVADTASGALMAVPAALSVAGASVPNALGRALLHNEKLS